jgi:solute carrier family 25 carnitine/acylcarnitine transporter 20/29
MSLYRTEGIRFFFAGTAGPILGLAFIDSAFFGLYGRVMCVSNFPFFAH